MAEVTSTARIGDVSTSEAVVLALQVYSDVRKARSQWLVNSSRRVCELQHSEDFGNPLKRARAETCFEEIMDRTLKIWNFDPVKMMKESVERYGKTVASLRNTRTSSRMMN
jgi:salicylate hydroxylase